MRVRELLRVGAPVICAVVSACSSTTTESSGAKAARIATPNRIATSQPTIFAPDVISDANEQWRITFTPDGKTAYFAESPGFFPITRQATIYVSQFENGVWTTPIVAPFSGVYSDIDPFISPNGQRLYFASIRPVNGVVRGDIDIWYVERTATGWSDPVRAGDEVNSTLDELYPSASADGTLYFASGPLFPQAGKHFDIYSAERSGDGFQPRVALSSAVNTSPSATDPNLQSAWDFNPEISVDGKTLIFTSLRPGYGLGDLYVSHKRGGEWSQAENLGPVVNTAADEFHPTLSRNKQELYFVRRIPRRGDFYVVLTSAIPALNP
jgi:Tol biopolymer transport system component